MSQKIFYSDEFIFTSRGNEDGGTITLKAGPGEILNIEGISSGSTPGGLDGSVQYNKLGDLAGESIFTYDDINNELAVPTINSNKFGTLTDTDSIGLNQLSGYHIVSNSYSGTGTNFGTSVSISINGTDYYSIGGCPLPGTEFGGVLPNSSIASANFTSYSSILQYTDFTSISTAGVYSDINEDGNMIAFSSQGGTQNSVCIYNRSGSVWSSLSVISNFLVPKISGNYMYLSDNSLKQSIYFYNGSSWSEQFVINSGVGSGLISLCDLINEDNLLTLDGNNLVLKYRSGTSWYNTQSSTITSDTYIDLSFFGLVAALVSSTKLYIYERVSTSNTELLTLIISFTLVGITAVTTNGTYIFVSNASGVIIYSKILGTWTQSVNITSLTSINKLACNSLFLMCGRPTSNNVAYYRISSYVNTIIDDNSITLYNGTDDNINIFSLSGGINFNSSFGAFSKGITVNSGLGLGTGGYAFKDFPNTGFYSETGNVSSFRNNNIKVMSLTETSVNSLKEHKFLAGDTSNPSLRMGSEIAVYGTNTIGNGECGIKCSGTQVMTINKDRVVFNKAITFTNGYFLVSGTTAQGLSTGSYNKLITYWGTSTISGDAEAPMTFSSGNLTVARSGYYYLRASCTMSGNVASNTIAIRISTSTGTEITKITEKGNVQKLIECNTIYPLTAGQIISASVFCDQPMSALANDGAFFTAYRVS